MHTVLILAAIALLILIAAYRRRCRRPKCLTCGARMSQADGGWQCAPCWKGYERSRAAGRSTGWNPGTWS